ncbi:hypothetical protein T07_7678 [Trichinella nelsoni]|uniref:Uncharacterized protein n=1 Tax=Trichinella nelsoni TaxID=6336 RepID=A0A0V0RAH2_9BILA|nr:hypothetical protein T07_7678 [Trichinella nelsoni]
MGPHMSECTSSRTSFDLLVVDLGKGKRHCFPFKQMECHLLSRLARASLIHDLNALVDGATDLGHPALP